MVQELVLRLIEAIEAASGGGIPPSHPKEPTHACAEIFRYQCNSTPEKQNDVHVEPSHHTSTPQARTLRPTPTRQFLSLADGSPLGVGAGRVAEEGRRTRKRSPSGRLSVRQSQTIRRFECNRPETHRSPRKLSHGTNAMPTAPAFGGITETISRTRSTLTKSATLSFTRSQPRILPSF